MIVPAGAAGFTILLGGVRALGLPKKTAASLQAPLKQAVKLFTDNKPGNDGAACDKLTFFRAHVDARLADGTLSPEKADLLVTYAAALADSTGCIPWTPRTTPEAAHHL